jgi:hypothetical protein
MRSTILFEILIIRIIIFVKIVLWNITIFTIYILSKSLDPYNYLTPVITT